MEIKPGMFVLIPKLGWRKLYRCYQATNEHWYGWYSGREDTYWPVNKIDEIQVESELSPTDCAFE